MLAYGLPAVGDSQGAGIGAGTRRLLFYGPTAMPGNVGPMQEWEALLAAAGAPALPLPPDWERAQRRRVEGDDVGDLTATTPPGPPSPTVAPIAPTRTMDELRNIGMQQAQALLLWAGNPTASGGAQAATLQIVNTFGAICSAVNRRLESLAASTTAALARGASTVTTELQHWLGVWATGSYALWQQAASILSELAHGTGQGLGFGVVALAALAVFMFTRSKS